MSDVDVSVVHYSATAPVHHMAERAAEDRGESTLLAVAPDCTGAVNTFTRSPTSSSDDAPLRRPGPTRSTTSPGARSGSLRAGGP